MKLIITCLITRSLTLFLLCSSLVFQSAARPKIDTVAICSESYYECFTYSSYSYAFLASSSTFFNHSIMCALTVKTLTVLEIYNTKTPNMFVEVNMTLTHFQ